MKKLKVGDIISFPADAQFGSSVSFKRPSAGRKFIVVEAEFTGGSAREMYPDGLHVVALALSKDETLSKRNHALYEFVQAEADGGHCYSSAIAGVKVEKFKPVTIIQTTKYTERNRKISTIEYQVG